jgi:hypothetical protein
MKLIATLIPLALASSVAAESITIQAGAQDRNGTVVTFQAPDGWRSSTKALENDGSLVQVDELGHATLYLRSKLPKGEGKTFTVGNAPPAAASSGITTSQGKGILKLEAKSYANDGATTPVFTYQMLPGPVPEGTAAQFAHGSHLHPVYSPGGLLVTGNHPPDHPHQRGIWFAWTHTDFEGREVDFWNMGNEKHGGVTGEVRFDKLLKQWAGPVHGGFVSNHRWIDHTSGAEKDMLHETWEVTVYHTIGLEGSKTPVFLIDLVSTQTCAGNEAVKLPKYHYGGLGVRGNALWDPPPNVTMLTSNGDDRIKGDGTKAKWAWLGGEVDGKPTGITVLIHPSNFRFPQPLRLNPKNPQICVAPSADGDWSIEPGKPYDSHYRIVIRDGKPDAAEFERLWNDYADPAKADLR